MYMPIFVAAEDGGLVFSLWQSIVDDFCQLICGVNVGKIHKSVNLLGGGKLHGGHHQYAGLISCGDRSSAVSGAVMVGNGDNVVAGKGCHVNDIVGSHILSSAGRQAGVDMKIGKKLHYSFRSSWSCQASSYALFSEVIRQMS